MGREELDKNLPQQGILLIAAFTSLLAKLNVFFGLKVVLLE